jgi:hypothetical protein
MVNLFLAGFLAAHGLVHALYLAPRPPSNPGAPQWPFDMGRSWLVTQASLPSRTVTIAGTLLIGLTVIGFGLSAFAALGWIVPSEWWEPLVVGSAAASAVLLGLFFHPYLIVGFLIDAVLVWAVVVMSWNPA